MIEFEQLVVKIEDAEILNGVSALLAPGSLIGLIGPNGAGKSTLMRALAGLIPTSAGTVQVDGNLLSTYTKQALAKKISYLPQGHVVHWPLELHRLVALGRLPHLGPFSKLTAEDERAVQLALEKTDLVKFAQRTVTTLSGGEQARAMLARTLAADTPVLLADEPVAALDPYHQLQVMDLLRDIVSAGRLVVVVLHDLGLAARYCDRLILMNKGLIVADGSPDEVLTDEYMSNVYNIQAFRAVEGKERFVFARHRLPLAAGQ